MDFAELLIQDLVQLPLHGGHGRVITEVLQLERETTGTAPLITHSKQESPMFGVLCKQKPEFRKFRPQTTGTDPNSALSLRERIVEKLQRGLLAQ